MKAAGIFGLLEAFFKAKVRLDKKLGSICTDRVPALLGNKAGFVALVTQKVPGI